MFFYCTYFKNFNGNYMAFFFQAEAANNTYNGNSPFN